MSSQKRSRSWWSTRRRCDARAYRLVPTSVIHTCCSHTQEPKGALKEIGAFTFTNPTDKFQRKHVLALDSENVLFETIDLLGNGGEKSTTYCNALSLEAVTEQLDNLAKFGCIDGDAAGIKAKITAANPAKPPAAAAAEAAAASYYQEDY